MRLRTARTRPSTWARGAARKAPAARGSDRLGRRWFLGASAPTLRRSKCAWCSGSGTLSWHSGQAWQQGGRRGRAQGGGSSLTSCRRELTQRASSKRPSFRLLRRRCGKRGQGGGGALKVDTAKEEATKAALLGHCVRRPRRWSAAWEEAGRPTHARSRRRRPRRRRPDCRLDAKAATQGGKLRSWQSSTPRSRCGGQGGGAGGQGRRRWSARGGRRWRIASQWSIPPSRRSRPPEGSSASWRPRSESWSCQRCPLRSERRSPRMPSLNWGHAHCAGGAARTSPLPIVHDAVYRTFQKHELKELKRPPGEMRLAFPRDGADRVRRLPLPLRAHRPPAARSRAPYVLPRAIRRAEGGRTSCLRSPMPQRSTRRRVSTHCR